MNLFRCLLFVCAVSGAGAMGIAIHRILGPDLSFPPRGWWFDVKWITFHTGPYLVLAMMAMRAGSGDRWVPFAIANAGAAIMIPGLMVAWNEVESEARQSRLYGIQSFAAVLLQYLAVGALGAILYWRKWKNRQPSPQPPHSPQGRE